MKKRRIIISILFCSIAYLTFFNTPLKNTLFKLSIKKIYASNFEEIPAIPGITPEFIGTYKYFLQAKSPSDYIQAAEAFKKIGERESETNILRLYSLFLATYSSFLGNDIKKAYKTALKAIVLARKVYPDEEKLKILDETIKDIEKGRIKDIGGIKERFEEKGLEPLAENDLFILAERRREIEKMEEKINSKIKKGEFLKPSLYKQLNRINEIINILKERCKKSSDISQRLSPFLPEVEQEYTKLRNELDSVSFTTVQEGMRKIARLNFKIGLLEKKLKNWQRKLEKLEK